MASCLECSEPVAESYNEDTNDNECKLWMEVEIVDLGVGFP